MQGNRELDYKTSAALGDKRYFMPETPILKATFKIEIPGLGLSVLVARTDMECRCYWPATVPCKQPWLACANAGISRRGAFLTGGLRAQGMGSDGHRGSPNMLPGETGKNTRNFGESLMPN